MKPISIVLVIASLFSCYFSLGQICNPVLSADSLQYNVDGPISTLVTRGDTLYIGGNFSLVGKTITGPLAEFDYTGQLVSSQIPYILGGSVQVIKEDGSGGYFLGGYLWQVGDSVRHHIARVDANGSVMAWHPVIALGEVKDIMVCGNTVFIAGTFNTVNGATRRGLAALDKNTGQLLNWNAQVQNASGVLINKLENINGKIYFSGFFDTVGGVQRHGIAAVDSTTAAPDSWNPNPDNSAFNSIYRGSDALYVYGQFNTISGQPRNSIAAYDFNGNLLPWAPDVTSRVKGAVEKNNKVYLSGDFVVVNSTFRYNLCALNKHTAALEPWNPTLKYAASWNSFGPLVFIGDSLYVGGSYDSVGNQRRFSISVIDTLGNFTPFAPMIADFSGVPGKPMVYAIIKHGNNIMLGGGFSGLGDSVRNGLAAIDINTGKLTAWDPGKLNHGHVFALNYINVKELYVDSNKIYIGGAFTNILNQTRYGLAEYDIDNDSLTSWVPALPAGYNMIEAIDVTDSIVYAGGSTSSFSGHEFYAVRKSDGSIQGSREFSDSVKTILVDGNMIYVGGKFKYVSAPTPNNNIRTYAAALHINNLHLSAWNLQLDPNYGNCVYSIQKHKDGLYFGGNFTKTFSSAPSIKNLVSADTSSTTHVRPWDADAEHTFGMHLFKSKLYLASHYDMCFYSVDTQSAMKTLWHPEVENIYSPGPVGMRGHVFASTGDHLFLGGRFTKINGRILYNLARYEYPLQGSNPQIIDPQVTIAADSSICVLTPVTFHANTNLPSYGTVYQWQVNGNPVLPKDSLYTYYPANNDVINCIVRVPGNGCYTREKDTSESITMEVMPYLTPSITLTAPSIANTGDPVNINATVLDAGPGHSIGWFNKSALINTTTTPNITFIKSADRDSIVAIVSTLPGCFTKDKDTSELLIISPMKIPESERSVAIKMYPNPVRDYFIIEGLLQGDQVKITDVSGREIKSELIRKNNVRIVNMSHLPPGAYTCTLYDNNGEIIAGAKIIK